MPPSRRLAILAAAILTLGSAGAAAAQDVQTGITAWQSGDYPRAITTWRPLAEAGDADAQFNLGQAYRLGRGVPQDLNLAEQWFERAARQHHEQAGSALGLLLFQNGRAREAMPWIQAAAMRGDPRAQYVFGTALFNGDILRRDLPRAYALMTVAASQGFPQAQTQLAEMDRQLGPEDKARGAQIAAEMRSGAPAQVADNAPRPRPRGQDQAVVGSDPRPAPRTTIPNTRVVEPQLDPRGAGVSYRPPQTADGGPAEVGPPPRPRPRPDRPAAGVSYAPPSSDGDHAPARMVRHDPPAPERHVTPPRPRPVTPPVRVANSHPSPRPAATHTPPHSSAPGSARGPVRAAGGSWRVQLGAFGDPGNARRRLASVQGVAALRGHGVSLVRVGPLTRVVAGGFASRDAAQRACAAVPGQCATVAP